MSCYSEIKNLLLAVTIARAEAVAAEARADLPDLQLVVLKISDVEDVLLNIIREQAKGAQR